MITYSEDKRCIQCGLIVQIQYVDDKANKIVERYDTDDKGNQQYVIHSCYIRHSLGNSTNGTRIIIGSQQIEDN